MSTLEVARYLLENGADPNAHYLWGGECRFTALCAVFGEGEAGPGKFPRHPDCETFARLLLDAGADPNDGQALYNQIFTPDNLCLELMLEYGLGPDGKCNWGIPDQTLRYQLNFAIESGYTDRARMLIKHGADHSGEPSLYRMAKLTGDGEEPPLHATVWHGDLKMVKLLVELGTDISITDRTHNATPLQWAKHHGDREAIVKFLEEC